MRNQAIAITFVVFGLMLLTGAALAHDSYAKSSNTTQVTMCHIPKGNPQNAQTIVVSQAAVPAHLAIGDTLGACS